MEIIASEREGRLKGVVPLSKNVQKEQQIYMGIWTKTNA